MNKSGAVQVSERLGRGKQHLGRLAGGQRADRNDLSQVLLSIFHDDEKDRGIVNLAATVIEKPKQMRMGKFFRSGPARHLIVR